MGKVLVGKKQKDSFWFAVVGGVLSAVAAFTAWQELALEPEILLLALATVCSVLALLKKPAQWAGAGPLGLVLLGVGGGAWYAATKHPLLLWGLGVAFLGATLTLFRSSEKGSLYSRVSWYALAVTGLSASWAAYFHFFTLGFAEEALERRMLPTLLWLAGGVSLALFGNRKGNPDARLAGLLLLAATVGKALLYDTTHLFGWARVAVFAVCGVVLLGSSRLLRVGEARE